MYQTELADVMLVTEAMEWAGRVKAKRNCSHVCRWEEERERKMSNSE